MPQSMTHRERVLQAVSLKEPDRVPMDLGSHLNSSIHMIAYENLKNYMQLLTGRPMTLKSKMMQDVMVDDEILNALDIDVRGVFYGAPDNAGPGDQPDGTWIDEWGVIRAKPEEGYYYDVIPPAPLAGDISLSDIVNYPWPDPDDPGHHQKSEGSGRALAVHDRLCPGSEPALSIRSPDPVPARLRGLVYGPGREHPDCGGPVRRLHGSPDGLCPEHPERGGTGRRYRRDRGRHGHPAGPAVLAAHLSPVVQAAAGEIFRPDSQS